MYDKSKEELEALPQEDIDNRFAYCLHGLVMLSAVYAKRYKQQPTPAFITGWALLSLSDTIKAVFGVENKPFKKFDKEKKK